MDRLETWKWPITDHKNKPIGNEHILYIPNTEKHFENRNRLAQLIKDKTEGYRLVSYYYDRSGNVIGHAWAVHEAEPLLNEAVRLYQFPEGLR